MEKKAGKKALKAKKQKKSGEKAGKAEEKCSLKKKIGRKKKHSERRVLFEIHVLTNSMDHCGTSEVKTSMNHA